jgi:hypothetical protein
MILNDDQLEPIGECVLLGGNLKGPNCSRLKKQEQDKQE